MYVYILSDYGEDGAENVTATLDRSKLVEMVELNWPFEEHPDHYSSLEDRRRAHAGWIARAHAGLARVLASSDEALAADPNGWNCHDGWGGMMLHVVRLV